MLAAFLCILFIMIALEIVWCLCHGDVGDFLFFIFLFALLMILD